MAGVARLLLLLLLLGVQGSASGVASDDPKFHQTLQDSSLHFDWKDGRSRFRPGATATLQMPYRGEIATVETTVEDAVGEMNVVPSNWTFLENNYQQLSFQVPSSLGDFSVHVTSGGSSLPGSPFGFSVLVADVAIAFCVGTWMQGNRIGVEDEGYLSVLIVDKDNITVDNTLIQFVVAVPDQPKAISAITMKLRGVLEIIMFTAKILGNWKLSISFGSQQIIGSPFSFRVIPANVSVTACIASWVNNVRLFKAGTQGAAQILLKDVYNNTLDSKSGVEAMVPFYLSLVGIKSDKRDIPDPEFSTISDFESGCQYVYFVAKLAGFFFLNIGTEAGSVAKSPLTFDVVVGNLYVPECVGQFLPASATYQAGTRASAVVQLKDQYGNSIYNGTFGFTVSVNGKVGASRYISNVNTSKPQPGLSLISFMATAAGTFALEIGDGSQSIKNSPVPYTVTGGNIHVPLCVAEWVHDVDTYVAGDRVAARVLLVDAFNNNISEATGRSNVFFAFSVRVISYSDMTPTVKNVKVVADPYESGYVLITFDAYTSGVNGLVIGNGTYTTIFNSPLNFTIVPGPISMNFTFLEWPYKCDDFQIDSAVQLIVNKRDIYGNPVTAEVPFIVKLSQASTKRFLQDDETLPDNTSIPIPNTTTFDNPDDPGTFPISDLNFTTVDPPSLGKLLISFMAFAGLYKLEVTYNGSIVKGSPASYSTFSGIVDPTQGNCSGLGFTQGIIGKPITFDLQLLDSTGESAYENGANVSMRRTVHAFLTLDTIQVQGTVVSDPVLDGLYHITYSTARSGMYNIIVTWMYNVICQGVVNIAAGPVVIAKTTLGGEGLLPKVTKGVMQQLYILLVDQTGNSVQGQRSKIQWTISGSGNFEAQDVLDIGTGYSTAYTIFDTGSFSIRISYDNTALPGTPKTVQVLAESAFPKAVDDTVWTWEEVSITIDVITNDYVPSGAKRLAGFYKIPSYGSMLMEGTIIRYTPRRGFAGTDIIIYILADSTNQLAYGFVYIAVLTEPPDFTFWPDAVVAIEGQPISTLDAFNGFHVAYTNVEEVLTLNVQAEHGRVYLPADALQLWHGIGFQNSSDQNLTNLTLQGNVNFINRALQDFLYLGDMFYNGNDTLDFSVTNTNGTGDKIKVPVRVQAFNNAPYIQAPNYVYKDPTGALRALSGDTVAFRLASPINAITVGDPDENDDGVTYLMEVTLETTDGSLTVTLPDSSAESTEYRPEGGYLWQPSLGASISSGFFTIVAQAIRFRAPTAECNIAFATIKYNGTKDGEALNIIVNDMGNFGCSDDCINDYTIPLTATAQVIIFTKLPRSTWWAYMKQMKIFGSSIGSVGIVMIFLAFLVCMLGLRSSRNLRRAALQDFQEIKDDDQCDATRVYNPLWIPEPADKKFVSVPNPLILQQRQQELRQRLREVDLEVEQLRTASSPTPMSPPMAENLAT